VTEAVKTILLLGSGGREHALAWKMAQSPAVTRIWALPGSDGIGTVEKTECLGGDAVDIAFVVKKAQELKPDLVVVGPDAPPAVGVVDALEKAGVPVLGPRQAAAQLESSKIFAKEFMTEFGIPTAPFKVADSYDDAVAICQKWDIEHKGIVIKADGLAAGKGVVVTHDRREAMKTLHDFMANPACSVKAERILLEEKISGKEVSAFALYDGKTFLPLGYACDYKRVNDNDKGPNTGGMGGYSPKGWPSDKARQFVQERIFHAALSGMQKRGTPFKGILYAGLMVDGDDVKVIEFNTRFGDPEAQILLPLIAEDVVPLFADAANGKLGSTPPALRKEYALHVVLTSEGYPETLGTGMRLGEKIDMPTTPDNTLLFISGAKKQNNQWVNNGGRVMGVTALGATIEEARTRAYAAVEKIHFQGAHWRKDIGR
jgi:phosphoribosylamine--glycine ligase